MKRLSNQNGYYLLAICCLLLIAFLYILVGRDLVVQLLNAEASSTFSQVIKSIYPRFDVESQRFSQEFFLKKADQLIVRVIALLVLALLFVGLYSNLSFKTKVHSFWNKYAPVEDSRIFISGFYLVLFFFTKDWFFFLQDLEQLTDLYKPHSFYAFFHISFPSAFTLQLLWVVYIISITLTVLWIKPLWFSSLASALFIFLQGFLYSFEKINHAFATLGIAVILFPLFIYYNINSNKKGKPLQAAWPIVLIKLSVGIAYLQSGLEKLLNSGFNWIYKNSFFLSNESDISFELLMAMVLLFQLGFVFFTWKGPMKWLFLLGGIFFHFSTVVFINVGSFLNPWIAMYCFWLIKLKNL